MACRKWNLSINEYIDDLLPAEKKSAFEIHLADCLDCSRDVREFSKVITMVKSLSQVTPPFDFEDKVKIALKSETIGKKETIRKTLYHPGMIKWVGAAAVFLLLVGVLTDRLNITMPIAFPQEADQAMFMEAAPANEETVAEMPQADARQTVPPVDLPKPAAEVLTEEKDAEEQITVLVADTPGISTESVDLRAESVLVTIETLRSIAERHGMQVLDVGCQGLTLKVNEEQRIVLYEELSRYGVVVETGDYTGGDTVSIMILYGIE